MNDAGESVILVDRQDRVLGNAPKLETHQRGDLHRAFSILIHDGEGNLLLQQRNPTKYHSGGLWTNACCGHPRPGEDTLAAAQRRLREEMGIACTLSVLGTLVYRADVGRGLVEHELVHLFKGRYAGAVRPDAQEIEAYAWHPLCEIERAVTAHPEHYTAWFRRYLAEKWPLALTS